MSSFVGFDDMNKTTMNRDNRILANGMSAIAYPGHSGQLILVDEIGQRLRAVQRLYIIANTYPILTVSQAEF